MVRAKEKENKFSVFLKGGHDMQCCEKHGVLLEEIVAPDVWGASLIPICPLCQKEQIQIYKDGKKNNRNKEK